MARMLPPIVGLILLAAGCNPYASFQPETVEIGDNKLIIKGWIQGERFCAEIRLDSKQTGLVLHSVNLISADGQKHSPDKWEDKTPKARTVPVSFGLGFGFGGGGHSRGRGYEDREYGGRGAGADDGGGTTIMPKVGFPLKLGKDPEGVSAVQACWKVSKDAGTSPVTGCTLEVNLASVQKDKIEVTTVTLAMAVHEDEDDEKTPAKPDAQQSAKDIISEIDFTLKGPPKTKTLAT